VLGRNGVGKTTLLATIMGHTTFHAGSIEYQGKPIGDCPSTSAAGWASASSRRRGTSSFAHGRGESLRRLAARPAGRRHASTILSQARRAASALGNQISGGEQQMLAIGRALMATDAAAHGRTARRIAPIIVEVLLQACSV